MRQILFLLALCIAVQTTPSFADRIQVKRSIPGRAIGVTSRLTTTNELQNLADAAALAGASAIGSQPCPSCTARQRWDNAREAALQVVQSSSLNNRFDASQDLSLAGSNRMLASKIKEAPNYEIEAKVERGRWLPKSKVLRRPPRGRWPQDNSNKNGKFESFEGSWQERHPGMPNFMAFNAVRVTLVMKKSINANTRVGRFLYTKANATAVVSLPKLLPTAPMAIHVCALLDDTGDYNPTDLCLADRLFTATSQHCPQGEANCGNIPQFFWDPKPASINNRYYWKSLLESSSLSCVSDSTQQTDQACFWPSPRYQKPFNNYGVIGMPVDRGTNPGTLSEETIAAAITTNNTNASIGGKFFVFADGLKTTESEEKIWKRIINTDGVLGESNPEFDSISSLRPDKWTGNAINLNYNSYFFTNSSCGSSTPTNGFYPKPNPTFWPGETGGTCNSRRSGWGHWDYFGTSQSGGLIAFFDPTIDLLNNPTPPTSTTPYQNHFNTLPVWEISLAVIADVDVEAKSCRDLSASKEAIMDTRPYEIIGFVKAYVHDLDIGRDPPTFPDNTKKPFSSERIGWKYNNSLSGLSPSDPSHPWGFTSPEGTPIPCNLIRARLACNQAILPAAQGGGETEISPVLVPE
ncbi:MAG: hypothetical protein GYA55_11210, partial [SAR324 cluster bacterium]|nr:hypothetical protein [SAR324 cluster bacterium]